MRYYVKIITLGTVVALGSWGCVAPQAAKRPLEEERVEITELKKRLAETNMRIDELGNKFMLLQEKIESNVEKIADTTAEEGETPKNETPEGEAPEGLKVVKLQELEEIKRPPAPKPEILYKRGQDLFLAGKYARARKVFRDLVETSPNSTLADNALYWSGESYYAEGNFESAISKFREVTEKYPYENKASDAMLKMGYSYIESGDPEEGAATLGRLIDKYEESQAADKARERLKKLEASN